MLFIVICAIVGIILPIVAANRTLPFFLYVIMVLLGIGLCVFGFFAFLTMIECIKEYKERKHAEYLEMLRLQKLKRQRETVTPILPDVVYDLIIHNGAIDCDDAIVMTRNDERVKDNDEYIRCELGSDVRKVLNQLADCGRIGKVYIGNMYIYKNISDEGEHMVVKTMELSVD